MPSQTVLGLQPPLQITAPATETTESQRLEGFQTRSHHRLQDTLKHVMHSAWEPVISRVHLSIHLAN